MINNTSTRREIKTRGPEKQIDLNLNNSINNNVHYKHK